MSGIRIVHDYPHPPERVWRALTDPQLIPLWTATGQGGRAEGFAIEVGTRVRFVGRPVPGWDGIVYCEVLEAQPASLLRYTWANDEDGAVTVVSYRLEPHGVGTRLTYEHAGFTGISGFLLANVVLGPVRKKMLAKRLPTVLADIDDDGNLRPASTLMRDLGLAG